MAGVARIQARMTVIGPNGLDGPFDVQGALAVTKWTGKRHMTLDDGVTDQALRDIGTGGITTITVLQLVSTQPLSIKFGATGANVAWPVAAYMPVLIAGTSLTAVALSNASGLTAEIEYALGGD